MPATEGKATIAGHDVFSDSLAVRRCVGYMPENVPLYPEMRVREYLSFRARLKGVPFSERSGKVDAIMEQCWVSDVKRRLIRHLSKGYRQRVGLAEALIHDPPVLILDEPTVGLDPNQIRQTRELIRQIGQERTVILSTHILPEAEMVCNRIILINEGRIVPEEEIDRLRKLGSLRLEVKADSDRLKSCLEALGEVQSAVVLFASEGVAQAEVTFKEGVDGREAVFGVCSREGWPILEMRQAAASLEEIFTKVTTREVAN